MNREVASARVVVVNDLGLHARPAARIVKIAESFDAEVTVTAGGQTVSGRSTLGLLMLGAGKGTEIVVAATGRDAHAAVADIVRLVEDQFDEEPDR